MTSSRTGSIDITNLITWSIVLSVAATMAVELARVVLYCLR
ncbi:hypothetical protein [Spirosoma pomorum]